MMFQFSVEHLHTDMFDLVSNHKAALNFSDNWDKLSSCIWVTTVYAKRHTVICIRGNEPGLTINVLNLHVK